MESLSFLQAVDQQIVESAKVKNQFFIGHHVHFSLDEYKPEPKKLAIIGLIEFASEEVNQIRKQFYQLKKGDWNLPIYDLGNLQLSNSDSDNEFAIQQLLTELIAENFVIVFLSNQAKYTYYQYKAYNSIKKGVKIAGIDSKLPIGSETTNLTEENLLNHFIQEKEGNLLDYVHLGFQRFYSAQRELDLFEHINFDVMSLGEITPEIKEVEPFLREMDAAFLNLNVIQNADFKSNRNPIPNGFTAREICSVSKYCGLSTTLSSFFIGNYLERNQKVDQLLVAQMLWYFFDGLNHRPEPVDFKNASQIETYYVQLPEQEIVFFHNQFTDQWWMQIKVSTNEKSYQIPCSKKDYISAMNGELPNRYWKAYKKYF